MKSAVGRQKTIVSLSEFKKQKESKSEQEKRSPADVLDEVSYHLLQAARVIAAQQRKH